MSEGKDFCTQEIMKQLMDRLQVDQEVIKGKLSNRQKTPEQRHRCRA